MQSQKLRNDLGWFPRQTIQHYSNPSLCPTTNGEEAEVEWLYEDLLELTPTKDVLFIIGDWNEKVESQEIPGVTGKFGLGVQNEAGQRLTEFSLPREHTYHRKQLLPTTQETILHMTSPDGQYLNQINDILCSQR